MKVTLSAGPTSETVIVMMSGDDGIVRYLREYPRETPLGFVIVDVQKARERKENNTPEVVP